MTHTFDPALDFVHVKSDGRILFEGEEIGSVARDESFPLSGPRGATWRAEIGNPGNVDEDVFPPYRVCYATTRRAAVANVLEGIDVPDA